MLYIIVGVLITIIIIFILINNALIVKKNYVEQAYSSVDVYLKKRNDLIPNLIEVVKKYTQHESETLTKITELRSKAESNRVNEKMDTQTDSALKNVMADLDVQVENYPNLKADRQYSQLMNSFNEMEGQISAARRSYNGRVTDYNNYMEMFPFSIIAGMKSYKRKAVFEANEADKKSIDAKKLFNS